MSFTTRGAVVLSLIVATAALSGCASGGAEASGTTQTPSATSSPAESTPVTPSATPTPSAEPADPGTWVISFDGVGPIAIGGSLQKFRDDQSALDDVTTDSCRVAMFDLSAGPAIWVAPAADDDSISGMTYGAALLGAQQPSGSVPATTEGIGLGDTLADLETAYPDLEEQPNDSGTWPVDYSITDGQGSWIVFGVKDDVVDAITVGDEPTTPLEYCG